MTKKHYEMLAKLIQDAYVNQGNDGMQSFAKNLAKELKADNPNFNAMRWFKACGFNAGREATYSYTYRGFRANCADPAWYVAGTDSNGEYSGSGILEWCTSEEDAIDRLYIMQKYARFTELKIGKWEND